MTDVGKLDQLCILGLPNEAARLVDRTDAILHAVQRDPGGLQLRGRQQVITALDLRVLQPLYLAQGLAQIEVDTERQSERAAENAAWRLREARKGECCSRGMSDENRRVIGRNLVVSLHVVTEILKVSVRQYTGAAILLEVGKQLRGIDSRDQRAVRSQRARHSRQAGSPAPIT